MHYKISRIPKGEGKFREVYIVSEEDRQHLRNLLPALEKILADSDDSNANYAFQRGRNCALNALQHIGHRYTLSMDLADFFDSVASRHVKRLIPNAIIEQCFINDAPRQGLPTSPIIASIAFLACDKKILSALKSVGIEAIYTRYADDLIFSFNNRSDEGKIKTIVRQVIENEGFKINERKTKLQDSKSGRIIITGIGVDRHGLHATRRTKKRIRAAFHQKKMQSLTGLVEWAKCKLPTAFL